MLPRIQLCARECTACPVFEATEDGRVAVYDSERPDEIAYFTPQDIRLIIDAASRGTLEQFTRIGPSAHTQAVVLDGEPAGVLSRASL
jgi:hypothetical protein